MTKSRILIVEDESVVALDISDRLESMGYQVVGFVGTGELAIRNIESTKPDLILMDVKLKGQMDGIQTAEAIRDAYNLPVIFLTAFADDATLKRAQITDAFGYILKPFEERELRVNIEMALYKYQMESKVRQSESHLRAIFNTALDGIFLIDSHGGIQDVNPAGCSMFGCTRGEILHSDFRLLFFNQDQEKEIIDCLGPQHPGNGLRRYRMRHKNGSELWIEMAFASIRSDDNPQVVIILRDVTVDVQNEQELINYHDNLETLVKERTYLLNEKNELLSREVLDRKRIEEQLKFQITALESAEIPMFVAEMDGTISWINHAFTTVTGFSPEEVVGKNANIYIANEKAAVFSDAFWQTNRARGVWHNESENRRRDGILYFQEATVTPVRDVSGQITHFVCVFQDITERKLYQAYLLKQSALAEIELAINQPNELQFVLHQIVEVTSRYLPASAGACVVLWDKSKKEYWVGDATLENFDEKPLSHMLCDPHGISYLVNHKRQPVIISNMALDPSEINNTFLIGGIFALAAYPLQVEEELLGILYVFENHPRIYTDWDQDFLTALANRAALAITRIKLYETLQAAKDAAEETIRAKSLLLANVSHEFRTPISAVIGLSELLLESKLDQNQKDLVTTMHSSAERLSALVNDILDFSKMEAKKLTLDVQSFDLRQCIESCLDLIAPRVDQNGLALAYFVDENIPKEIIGDPVRLGQVLTNLLSNAEKFTNSGSIIVNATIQEIHRATGMLGNKIKQNQILFSVKDTGIGIPPERTHLLYDSFTQLDPSATRKFGGTGLGLAICKQLVGLMGGKIWVESSGVPGQGSTFYFSIPFTPVNEVNAPHLNHDQNSLSGKLVLILSRSIVYQSAFQKYLNFWGLDTVIFENENDALKWIEINSLPQLAILDCRNSVLAFNQFSQRLNQITKPKTLPVIIFSSTLETIDEQNDFQIIGRLKNPIKPSLLYDLLISADSHTQQESKKIISDEQVLMQYPLEILVGEDDTANLKALTLRLKKLGYNPEAATDGKQVIQLLAERSFDVLILDLHMPEMDGLEITRYIRSTFPSNRQPYIVILTADTFLDVQDSVVDAGVNYFLTKPITGKELAKVLRNVVANQGEPISKLEQNQPLPDQPGYESVINMEILEDFMQAMGEDAPASIAEILHSFFENAPKLIVEIKIATANQDWNQLKWLAHSLKGNCELLGVVQLVQLCKSIGNDISNEKYESLAAQSALLEDAYLQAKKALENTFNLIDWR